MKKNYLLVGVALICITLTSCNKKNASSNRIWYSYSTENLLSDFDYFDGEDSDLYANRDNTLRFSCLKNENEGTQLMITASKYINSFDFELSDVTGSSGTISKDNFTVAAAYYMNIDFSNEKTAYSGYYPDALIPLSNFKFRRMNYIDKGRSQSLYINLKTTKDTAPGEYKGTGKLRLDDEIINIPIEVKVYDAVLPDAVHQNSAFGLWYDQIINGEKDNSGSQMDMAYYNFLVDKRISPRELPPSLTTGSTLSESFDLFVDNFVEIVVKNERIASLRLPIDGYNFSEITVKEILQKLINKNLELRNNGYNQINLFEKAFFYIDDEPFSPVFDLVRHHDKVIFDTKKELRNQLASYPDLYESFNKIPNVVTREFISEMVADNDHGGIQTWCPLISFFQTEENREIYRQRQASSDRDCGEHVWWYTCCDPVSPYPNFHLDSSVMLPRVFRYMQYDYNIEAQIFWSTNYYSKYSRGDTLPRDIWTDPISWQLCAGDGQLLYPGYSFGINGPITTLRLENILASNEEYEYLWMIDQKVQEYNSSHSTNYVTNELLNKYYSRLFNGVIVDIDTDNFESVRLELLNVIESLYSNIDNGMSLLMK